MKIIGKNPITGLDYPDPDVIRVDDTYYMVSTTMHFVPGCEILRSYDLVHWEHLSYVYERLDSTEEQRLVGEKNCYGKGMWAASLRYHKGMYYICFVANDTGKTYLYTHTSKAAGRASSRATATTTPATSPPSRAPWKTGRRDERWCSTASSW